MPRKQQVVLEKDSKEEKKAKNQSKEVKDQKQKKMKQITKQSPRNRHPSTITLSRKTLERLEESFSTEEINELKDIINSPRQSIKPLDEIEMKKITSLCSERRKSKSLSREHSKENVLKRKSSDQKNSHSDISTNQ